MRYGLSSRSTWRLPLGGLSLAALLAAGCAGGNVGNTAAAGSARGTTPAPAPPPASTPANGTVEQQVLAELNLARTRPAEYAAIVDTRVACFRGNLYQCAGDRVATRTSEGAAAVREAARALRATAPVPALRLSAGLSNAARDHVRDQGPGGRTGHTGTDGSSSAERANRYGRWIGRLTENISYGGGNGREVVVQLLVDDGVANRGHRVNALDPAVRVAGVACGAHRVYGQMCVVLHAAEYQEGSGAGRRTRAPD